jgi:hypothetical protein
MRKNEKINIKPEKGSESIAFCVQEGAQMQRETKCATGARGIRGNFQIILRAT